jgi:adenylate cyclase
MRDVIAALGDGEPAPGHRSCLLRLLAEGCEIAGEADGGLVATRLLLATRAGAGLWQAEALRLRAGFAAAGGAPEAQVRADLERALAVARAQGARSLQLRVAADLLRRRGDEPARRELAAALAALPEGEPTPDRSEAEALLGRGTLAERSPAHPPTP